MRNASCKLRRFFQRNYLPLDGKDATPIRSLLQSVFSFYRNENAAALTEIEGDMLLFQFGAYDWGSGPSFQVGLTRQFIELENGNDEYVLSQFHLTCHYAFDEQMTALGGENRWCSHISQVDGFAAWVERHHVLNAVETLSRKKTELCWDLV